jgi:DNA-binding response OmpR family regulator
MGNDSVDSGRRVLVVVVGDVYALPGPVLNGLTGAGALVARLPTPAAAVEWLSQFSTPARVLRRGGLEIDRQGRSAVWQAAPLCLTDQELDLLLALAEAPDCTLPFRELDLRVWGDRHRRDTQRIRSAVKRLRRKLVGARAGCSVRAVRGLGFQLVVPRGDQP